MMSKANNSILATGHWPLTTLLYIVILLFPLLALAEDNGSLPDYQSKLIELTSRLEAIEGALNKNGLKVTASLDNLSAGFSALEPRILGMERLAAELKKELSALAPLKAESEKSANRDTWRRIQAGESYKKAVELARAGDYSAAGIYYTNALALAPDNLSVLNGYTNSVLSWVEERKNKRDYDSALAVLSEYLRFLYTYQAGLDMAGVNYIAQTFRTLTGYESELTAERERWAQTSRALERGSIDAEIKALLAVPIPDNESLLVEQYRKLQLVLLRLANAAPERVDMADEIVNRQRALTDNLEALTLLSRGEEALRGMRPKDNISAYYSTNELFLTNQRLLSLKPTLTAKLAKRVDKYTEDLGKLGASLATDAEKSILTDLTGRRAELNRQVIRAKSKEEGIELLTAFSEEIALEIARAQNPIFAGNLRKMLSSAAGLSQALKEEQLTLYERWALGNLKSMYTVHSEDIGLLSGRESKDRVYAGLKNYLCPVDTRYLSVTGIKLFGDIYDFFTKELDRPMRIDLAVEFGKCKKKELAEF